MRRHFLARAKTFALASMAFCFIVSGYSVKTAHTFDAAQNVATRGELRRNVSFPLSISKNQRFLVDSAGHPFLLHGDAAWSLIADLSREEVRIYLEDRRARGFNTILVNLLERNFARKAPANIYGAAPFNKSDDFATPNDAYFAHVDWVLEQAQSMGFAVLLCPAYLGYNGGDQGWSGVIARNSIAKLRGYGRYLARRFADKYNIIWVAGGDYDPPDKSRTRAIIAGIREVAKGALTTAHMARGTSPVSFWHGDSWLNLNNIYTNQPVCSAALREYARTPIRPFFLIEGVYENEHNATEQRLRAQAYGAVLCGAAGHVFGNNPIWHFNAKGLYQAPVNWREALSGRGSVSVTHLARLLNELPWWELEPVPAIRIFVDGIGRGRQQVLFARSRNRAIGLSYLPRPQWLKLDLQQLGGPKVQIQWFDPSSGSYHDAGTYTISQQPYVELRTPAKVNAFGQQDWVLVLRSKN